MVMDNDGHVVYNGWKMYHYILSICLSTNIAHRDERADCEEWCHDEVESSFLLGKAQLFVTYSALRFQIFATRGDAVMLDEFFPARSSLQSFGPRWRCSGFSSGADNDVRLQVCSSQSRVVTGVRVRIPSADWRYCGKIVYTNRYHPYTSNSVHIGVAKHNIVLPARWEPLSSAIVLRIPFFQR